MIIDRLLPTLPDLVVLTIIISLIFLPEIFRLFVKLFGIIKKM